MSTVQSAPPTVDVTPAKAFDVFIWKTGAVCNDCLTRVRRNYPGYDEARDAYVYQHQNHLRWHITPYTDVDPTATTGYDDSGRRLAHCDECGQSNGRADSSDYTHSELKDRLRKVITRLGEVGLEPDEDTMYRVVERLKCEEQLGGQDTQILRRATTQGLEAACDEP